MFRITSKLRVGTTILMVMLILFMLFEHTIPANANTNPSTYSKLGYVKSSTITSKSFSAVTTYKLNHNKYKLVKGKTFALKLSKLPTNYRVTYKSNNTKIATVTTKGIVKGVKNGTVAITATVRCKNLVLRNLTCKVTVGPAAVSVVIPESKITLKKNQKRDLRPIVKPKYTAETPRFTSSDPSVVTVTSSGIIKGIKKGSAIITVSISNKKSDTIVVNVTNAMKNNTTQHKSSNNKKK